MTTADILRAAKARLTSETWGQGDGGNCTLSLPFGRVCASMVFRWTSRDVVALELLSRVTTGAPYGDVPAWNDAPERTLQDVHDAFDAAIVIAEQQERASDPRSPATELPTSVDAVAKGTPYCESTPRA